MILSINLSKISPKSEKPFEAALQMYGRLSRTHLKGLLSPCDEEGRTLVRLIKMP